MKLVLSILVLFASGALHSQILDTLRMDTCFNIAFNKTQVDYYYLKKEYKDIVLERSTKVLGIGLLAGVHKGSFCSERFIKTDKTGKKKEGEKDTMTVENPDGSINYYLIRSYIKDDFFGIDDLSQEIWVDEQYVIPNGNNWFFLYLPNGKAFRTVFLDSLGHTIAEIENNQIDSFSKSFIQMDKDSNVVVYQKLRATRFPEVLTFCLYPSGVKAFECIKMNDSTYTRTYYYRSGKKKMVSLYSTTEYKVEELSESDKKMGITEAWNTIETRWLKEYNEEGVLIKEE